MRQQESFFAPEIRLLGRAHRIVLAMRFRIVHCLVRSGLRFLCRSQRLHFASRIALLVHYSTSCVLVPLLSYTLSRYENLTSLSCAHRRSDLTS